MMNLGNCYPLASPLQIPIKSLVSPIFHLHLLAFTFSTMIIKPLMLLHYTLTLSPICEWDLERTYNGFTTDLERR